MTEHNALNFARGIAVQAPGWAVARSSTRNHATIVHSGVGLAVELRRQPDDVWTCEVSGSNGGLMWQAARATPWSAVKAAVTRAHTALVEVRVNSLVAVDQREAARAQAAALGALLTVVLAAAPEKAPPVAAGAP